MFISSKLKKFTCISFSKLNCELMTNNGQKFSSKATVNSLYHNYASFLLKREINEPYESVRHILQHALGLGNRKTDFEMSLNQKVSTFDHKIVSQLIRRRLKHEPVQYIVGEWDFMDWTFQMRAPVLICRQDTELLVEHSLRIIREKWRENPAMKIQVVDVGCGSGVIGISVSLYLERELREGLLKLLMVDRMEECLQLTTMNATSLLPPSHFDWEVMKCDITDGGDVGMLFSRMEESDCDLSIFISNPPYLNNNEMTRQKELEWEDEKSLVGGGERGEELVLRLMDIWLESFSSSKCQISDLVMEIDELILEAGYSMGRS